MNPKYCQMLGFSEAELTELTVDDVTHPDDVAMDVSNLEKAMRGELPEFRREKRYIRRDGSVLWVEINVTTFRDDQGSPSFNIAVAQDVSERKKVEEALLRSAENLRQITDIQPTLIGYLRRDFTYGFANKAYHEWFGLTAGEVVGRHVKDVIGGAAFEAIRERFERAFSGERIEFDRWIAYPTGERFVHAIYHPDRRSDGTVDGIFISVADKTEEKIYLDSLKASEEQFISLANSIPQLAWMADPSGSIFWYNTRWYEYTGTTPKEMLGWGWQKVHHPEFVEKVTA